MVGKRKRSPYTKNGWLRGKRNPAGGLACTVNVGAATRKYAPGTIYAGVWLDWLRTKGYTKIPRYLPEDSQPKLKPYEPIGIIRHMDTKIGSGIGAALKPLPNWKRGINERDEDSYKVILTIASTGIIVGDNMTPAPRLPL